MSEIIKSGAVIVNDSPEVTEAASTFLRTEGFAVKDLLEQNYPITYHYLAQEDHHQEGVLLDNPRFVSLYE